MSHKKEIEVAIIILAAGSSSRMGKSKQLITINGETLLEKSVTCALQSKSKNTLVVLGANEDEHRAKIENFSVSIVHNPAWSNGMGGSLKAGLNYLFTFAKPEAVIIMVCDQPLLTSWHINKLIDTYQTTHKPIIASSYSGSAGVPALFYKSIFDNLIHLDDRHGAKKVIESNFNEVITVDFPEGAVDLDTPEDVLRFISK